MIIRGKEKLGKDIGKVIVQVHGAVSPVDGSKKKERQKKSVTSVDKRSQYRQTCLISNGTFIAHYFVLLLFYCPGSWLHAQTMVYIQGPGFKSRYL
jgi:hypothetical protein